jgi:class III poly(R)-hydroxyalkanoic acid synthase PhaE subunit
MTPDPSDPQAPFVRQLGEYWQAWGRAVQQAAGGAAMPGMPGASADGLAGAGAGGGPWLQAIYQLAAQALEQKLDSAGIAAAWRRILKANTLWPGPADGTGMPGSEFLRQLSGWLKPWLDSPAFGPGREHMARWQQFARLQGQAQEHAQRLQTLLDGIMEQAISRFEVLLRPFEQEQAPLKDVRALFDLWIEAAEQAWEQAALGEEFAHLNAAATSAQMHLRQAAMAEAERLCAGLGLPTRSEVDQSFLRHPRRPHLRLP